MSQLSDTAPVAAGDPLGLPFAERTERMLSRVFGGLHHITSLKKSRFEWSCLCYGDLSTYDWDLLTRLVLGAHEYCLRVSVCQGGPRSVKVLIHPRINRDGCPMSERHPSIHQAIERWDSKVNVRSTP